MTLVILESFDGCGKTTLTRQLKEKYPDNITTIAYPSKRIRAVVEALYTFRMKDIDSLFKYHYNFLEDFAINNDILKEANKEDSLILCDRYFYSSATYFLKDLSHYMIEHDLDKDREFLTDLQVYLTTTLGTFYTELVQPDLIIYLAEDYWMDSEGYTTDTYYKGTFLAYPPKAIELVKAQRPDTTFFVEILLRDYGYL